MTDEEVWTHSVQALGDQPGRQSIHARADIEVAALEMHKLRAMRDDNPFQRHTLVLGWPDPADVNEKKETWKEICLQLSQSEMVSLALPVSPIRRT